MKLFFTGKKIKKCSSSPVFVVSLEICLSTSITPSIEMSLSRAASEKEILQGKGLKQLEFVSISLSNACRRDETTRGEKNRSS